MLAFVFLFGVALGQPQHGGHPAPGDSSRAGKGGKGSMRDPAYECSKEGTPSLAPTPVPASAPGTVDVSELWSCAGWNELKLYMEEQDVDSMSDLNQGELLELLKAYLVKKGMSEEQIRKVAVILYGRWLYLQGDDEELHNTISDGEEVDMGGNSARGISRGWGDKPPPRHDDDDDWWRENDDGEIWVYDKEWEEDWTADDLEKGGYRRQKGRGGDKQVLVAHFDLDFYTVNPQTFTAILMDQFEGLGVSERVLAGIDIVLYPGSVIVEIYGERKTLGILSQQTAGSKISINGADAYFQLSDVQVYRRPAETAEDGVGMEHLILAVVLGAVGMCCCGAILAYMYVRSNAKNKQNHARDVNVIGAPVSNPSVVEGRPVDGVAVNPNPAAEYPKSVP